MEVCFIHLKKNTYIIIYIQYRFHTKFFTTDAVSATSTLNFEFGSGIMLPSTHIILNDQMDDFSTPNTTNAYGIAPSKENFIEPQKRPQSSMSPIIITDENNNVRVAIGASGGPRIISAVAYVSFVP